MKMLLWLLASVVLYGQGVSVPPNTWTSLSPSGYTYRLVGWEKAMWVPTLQMACVQASYREISSEPNRGFACYSFTYNRNYIFSNSSSWHDPYHAEGGHPVAGMGLNTTNSVAYGAENFSGGQVSEKPAWTWWFDFAGLSGIAKQPATGLNYTLNLAGGQFDPHNGVHVMIGGTSFAGISEYTPSTNAWNRGVVCTTTSTDCPDPSIALPSTAFDTTNNKIYIFGGLVSTTLQNNLYTYDASTHTPKLLSPGGSLPTARQKAGFVYDSAANVFILYGGASVLPPSEDVLTDTWMYDPDSTHCSGNADGCWTQQSPTASPTSATSPAFERMVYDPDDDVVLLFNINTNTALWGFRYVNTGANAGNTSAPTYTASSGSRNINSDSWGERPVLIGNGSTLYASWIESGAPAAASAASYFNPYAVSLTTLGVATNLGGSYNSMASENANLQSEDVALAWINGALWGCWHEGNNGAFGFDLVVAKSWNGSSWTGGGLVGVQGGGNNQGHCSMVDVGGTPYIAFQQNIGGVPSNVNLYVMHWTGSAWSLDGGAINTGNYVDDLSMYSDGSHACVAWTDYTVAAISNGTTFTAPQVRASCFISSSWTAQGGSGNFNTANRAYAISASYLSGQLYVAFMERTDSGVAKLYVRTWNGSAWSTVGGALNRDGTTGWGFRPELVNDGTNLYVAWDEQQAIGSKPQVYVSKWNGSSWTSLGSSLNADSTNGAAEHPTITTLSGTPYVAWGELKLGTLRQIYAKQWNGTAWAALGAPAGGSIINGTLGGNGETH